MVIFVMVGSLFVGISYASSGHFDYIKKIAGQVSDLWNIQDENGVSFAKVDKDGNMILKSSTNVTGGHDANFTRIFSNGVQVAEGDYKDWTLITDVQLTGSVISQPQTLYVNNNGYSVGVDNSGNIFRIDSSGSSIIFLPSDVFPTGSQVILQSITGKYQLVLDNSGASPTINVYQNSTLLKTITVDITSKFLSGAYNISISPNGKYIVTLGEDFDTVHGRIQVYQGS